MKFCTALGTGELRETSRRSTTRGGPGSARTTPSRNMCLPSWRSRGCCPRIVFNPIWKLPTSTCWRISSSCFHCMQVWGSLNCNLSMWSPGCTPQCTVFFKGPCFGRCLFWDTTAATALSPNMTLSMTSRGRSSTRWSSCHSTRGSSPTSTTTRTPATLTRTKSFIPSENPKMTERSLALYFSLEEAGTCISPKAFIPEGWTTSTLSIRCSLTTGLAAPVPLYLCCVGSSVYASITQPTDCMHCLSTMQFQVKEFYCYKFLSKHLLWSEKKVSLWSCKLLLCYCKFSGFCISAALSEYLPDVIPSRKTRTTVVKYISKILFQQICTVSSVIWCTQCSCSPPGWFWWRSCITPRWRFRGTETRSGTTSEVGHFKLLTVLDGQRAFKSDLFLFENSCFLADSNCLFTKKTWQPVARLKTKAALGWISNKSAAVFGILPKDTKSSNLYPASSAEMTVSTWSKNRIVLECTKGRWIGETGPHPFLILCQWAAKALRWHDRNRARWEFKNNFTKGAERFSIQGVACHPKRCNNCWIDRRAIWTCFINGISDSQQWHGKAACLVFWTSQGRQKMLSSPCEMIRKTFPESCVSQTTIFDVFHARNKLSRMLRSNITEKEQVTFLSVSRIVWGEKGLGSPQTVDKNVTLR